MQQQDQEFDAIRKAVDDCQVVLKMLITDLERGQREIADRMNEFKAQLAGMENDLVLIKECLVAMRVRSEHAGEEPR